MLHSPIQAGPGSVELPRSLAPIVKADSLLYVHFERPDLEKAERYLTDFGLLVASRSEDEIFFRGTSSRPFIYRVTRGPKPRFLGLGLSAPTAGDLDALNARFVCVNGSARNTRALSLQSDDPGFIAWARKHRVRGVLVRPDRFIAARLNADLDLSILSLFAGAKAAALPRAA